MMRAELTIDRLHNLAQRLYTPQAAKAREKRDRFRQDIRRRLGYEEANRIERYVQATATPCSTGPLPYLMVESEEAFLTLLRLELRLRHAEKHIEHVGTFLDPYNARAVLPTLGLSWWADVRLMMEPPSHEGHMTAENTSRFLEMVIKARQWLPTQEQIEERSGEVDCTNSIEQWHEHFRQRRKNLVSFLERAVELKNGVWIQLMSY